jgi:ATP-dependent DNA ligase
MAWSFKQIEPQSARGVLADAMWDSPEWVAEEKYDGDRRIAQFMGTGEVRFTGRRKGVGDGLFVEKTANLPHLNYGPTGLRGTVLDGEIIYPSGTKVEGGASKYVTSIMGSLPQEAVRKQEERGWLEYVVFDCLWYKGRDVRGETLRNRRNYASQAVVDWDLDDVDLVEQVAGHGKRAFCEAVLIRGGEGVVLKHYAHKYGEKRGWVKVKAEATADVVILGFTKGLGKYQGQIGAIEFGQGSPGRVVSLGTCSGFDDGLRKMMTDRPTKYIGNVIEIKHNGREPTGAFRHPRFSRFRPDKHPTECVLDLGET